jgi:hypothetical protein
LNTQYSLYLGIFSQLIKAFYVPQCIPQLGVCRMERGKGR